LCFEKKGEKKNGKKRQKSAKNEKNVKNDQKTRFFNSYLAQCLLP
jgi:hypothetical protein